MSDDRKKPDKGRLGTVNEMAPERLERDELHQVFWIRQKLIIDDPLSVQQTTGRIELLTFSHHLGAVVVNGPLVGVGVAVAKFWACITAS